MSDFDIDSCKISASKHFALKYMRKWNWDFRDLRDAIKNAYRLKKEGSRKMIFIYDKDLSELFVISGSEGNDGGE